MTQLSMPEADQVHSGIAAADTPKRILHVLDHSQPHRSGYAIRSNAILQFQRKLGLEPVVLTSPKHGTSPEAVEEFGGILHHRTDSVAGALRSRWKKIPFLRERDQMRVMSRRIEQVARAEKVDLIHAHSPSLNGLPALAAARRLGLPVVYEIRAFWEDAAVDHGSFGEGSFRYRLSRMIETRLLRRVDAVTLICEGLRNEIIARDIPAEKITIIPNGVDLDRFAPRERDPATVERYGLRDKVVLGFLGSFYRYEGLSLLLEAFSRLIKSTPDVRLLLVGGGEEEANLRSLAASLGLGGSVIFTGSVPPDQILDLYSVVDILVYPRLSMRLTEWVTPLKPLEAMAMGKLVVASDVGGLKELVRDGETGLLFQAGDVDALTKVLDHAIAKRECWARLTEQARQHVASTRRWEDIAARYREVYADAWKSLARGRHNPRRSG